MADESMECKAASERVFDQGEKVVVGGDDVVVGGCCLETACGAWTTINH